jgi:hypothetical protein
MTTVLDIDPLADGLGGGPAGEAGTSGFITDTWVFFAASQQDWLVTNRWGLGFGPVDIHVTRWSLLHCVGEDSFDARWVYPAVDPANAELLRWCTSIVGSATATSLLESVGSCRHFYCQYFAERPDLRGRPFEVSTGSAARTLYR